jgi:HlyD family secretion protein
VYGCFPQARISHLPLFVSRRHRQLALALFAVAAVGLGVVTWRWLLASRPSDTLLISGNVEAHESVLSFKSVQSRIVTLPFDEGQWVTEGAVLARLEDHDYRQQVAVDEATVQTQERQLALALRNLEAAGRTVISDQADLQQKTIDYERDQELWRENVASTETRDLAETALKQSQAAVMRDRALQAAAAESVRVAKANIKSADENLKLAKIILGYTTLYAPFSGVILVRNAELGEIMQPGTPVFTLADLNHVWLRAYINETDIGRVRLGQAALITTDSYPGQKYVGRISMISENAEFTPKSVETHAERVTLVYRIRIDIENQSHELKPGMPADAMIELRPFGTK